MVVDKMTRRIRLMLVLTGSVIVGGIALTWLLNPYGATRSTFINPIFRKVKRERLVTPYLLQASQPETLLLGSSRVLIGMRIEQGERDGVMNAAMNGARLAQISPIVDVALQNPHLKRIVWGVDFFAFNSRWTLDDQNFNARISDNPRARLEDTLLSLDALGDGFNLLKRSRRGRAGLPATMRAEMPWPMALICNQYVADRIDGMDELTPTQITNQLHQVMHLLYGRYEYSQAQEDIFRATVERIRAHNIELVLFVPPMNQYELELIRQSGHWGDFERFKRAVAAAGPFYDFATYNEMSRHLEFYLQVIHFKASVGHQILRKMLGLEDHPCDDEARIVGDSVIRADESSINGILTTEALMRDQAIEHDSQYSRLASEAVRYSRTELASEAATDSGVVDQ